jgi:hypothetical protein
MKKTDLLVLALIALALTGCVGTTVLGVLDESIPEESQCPLEIRKLAVIVYDNQPVEWITELGANKIAITLPPGEHTFMTRYYVERRDQYFTTTYPVLNTITQEFLPGHSYRLYRQSIWLILFTINNIKIKDVTPKNRI